MSWERWERNSTRRWHEHVLYSMGTIYHTMGRENGPGKWPHCLPVVFPPAPDHSASSASCMILIQKAYHFLLMYRQNTASQKYPARRIGPRHIKRNSNICMAIIQNAANLTPVEKMKYFLRLLQYVKQLRQTQFQYIFHFLYL